MTEAVNVVSFLFLGFFGVVVPPRLRMASGLVSFSFGAVVIYGIGFAEGGLFTDAPIWELR